MCKKSIILPIILIFSIITFGQSFEVPDFTPDSLTSWQIRFKGNMEGNVNDKFYKESEYDDEEKERDLSLNPETVLKYTFLRPDQILRVNINPKYIIDTDNSMDKDQYDDQLKDETESNSQTVNISGNINYTKYFRNNLGLHTKVDFSSSQGWSNWTQKNIYPDTTNDYNYYSHEDENTNRHNITLQMGILKGRIYNGSYATKAKELTHYLKEKGLLLKDLSKEEYKKLSQIIMQNSAIYHFDRRLKRNQALKNITNYLKSIEAIKAENTLAHITIFDTYTYNNFNFYPQQQFGLKYYLDAGYDYYISQKNSIEENYRYNNNPSNKIEPIDTDTSESSSYIRNPFVKGEIKYAKIFNHYFFSDISFSIRNTWHNQNDKKIYINLHYTDFYPSNNKEYEFNSLNFNLNNYWYYKWNTRTLLQFGFDSNYNTLIDQDGNTCNEIDFYISGGLTYRFTPRFRIHPTIYFDYRHVPSIGDFNQGIADFYFGRKDYTETDLRFELSFSYYL